jgi:hypothetical protein
MGLVWRRENGIKIKGSQETGDEVGLGKRK